MQCNLLQLWCQWHKYPYLIICQSIIQICLSQASKLKPGGEMSCKYSYVQLECYITDRQLWYLITVNIYKLFEIGGEFEVTQFIWRISWVERWGLRLTVVIELVCLIFFLFSVFLPSFCLYLQQIANVFIYFFKQTILVSIGSHSYLKRSYIIKNEIV